MSHRKTLVASGISVLSVILNKTFTMLNDKGICIVYSGKSALELCFKTPKERVKPAKCFIVTGCCDDFIIRTENVVLFV